MTDPGEPTAAIPPAGPRGPRPPPPTEPTNWVPWAIAGVLAAISLVLVVLLLLDDDDTEVSAGGSTTSTVVSTTTSSTTTSTTLPATSTTAATTTTALATTTTVGPPPTVTPDLCRSSDPDDPDTTALVVYQAYALGDRGCANNLMTDDALDQLFSIPGGGGGWDFAGCTEQDEPDPHIDCAFTFTGGATHFAMNYSETAGWTVFDVTQTAD